MCCGGGSPGFLLHQQSTLRARIAEFMGRKLTLFRPISAPAQASCRVTSPEVVANVCLGLVVASAVDGLFLVPPEAAWSERWAGGPLGGGRVYTDCEPGNQNGNPGQIRRKNGE